MTFDAGGRAVENTFTEASAALLRAVSADIQAVDQSGGVELRSAWDCTKASLALVALCGGAVAKCVRTLGLGCVSAGTKCFAAALDWQCACKNTSC